MVGVALTAAQRLLIALDLYEVGEQMQRQRLLRSVPHANEDDVDSELRAWLHHRPGAEHGDYPGPRSQRFR